MVNSVDVPIVRRLRLCYETTIQPRTRLQQLNHIHFNKKKKETDSVSFPHTYSHRNRNEFGVSLSEAFVSSSRKIDFLLVCYSISNKCEHQNWISFEKTQITKQPNSNWSPHHSKKTHHIEHIDNNSCGSKLLSFGRLM